MTAPRTDDLPGWLAPVVEAASTITVHEITRFMPPEGSDPRRGAVLMVFADRAHDPDVPDRPGPDDLAHRGELLLTERAHHMRSHPGQVSFPGGSLDPGETPLDAALREAHEEIGLRPDVVTVLGALDLYRTLTTTFLVSPFVGYVPADFYPKPDELEVAHAFAAPLAHFLRGPSFRRADARGGWPFPVAVYETAGEVIWGATAAILRGLARRVFVPPWPDIAAVSNEP